MSATQDYLKLHFVVWIWGFTAILGLLITIPAVELVWYRTMIAALGLGILLYFRKQRFRLGRKEVFKILGTGFIISAHWILFFAAARVSTASVGLAGMATCSLWTSFLEPLVTKRNIKVFEIALGFMAIIGLYVIFRFEFNHALGLLMAVVSALLAAVFSVINGQLTQKHNPFMITFYEMIGAFLGTSLFFPFYVRWFTSDGVLKLTLAPMDYVYISILAIICTVYAFSVSVELMKRLSAFVVNLTINLEPVYGIILAVIVFGEKEQMEAGFYWGTAIILASVLIYPVINRYYRRKALHVDNLR